MPVFLSLGTILNLHGSQRDHHILSLQHLRVNLISCWHLNTAEFFDYLCDLHQEGPLAPPFHHSTKSPVTVSSSPQAPTCP